MIPINNDRSYYDLDKHTAYPTIDYILNETGENMIVLAGSELRAKAVIKQITDELKAYLSRYKLRETYNYMEYLIAFKNEWRNEFIKLVGNVIYSEYNMEETREEAIERVFESSNLFSIERFVNAKYKYRVGY